MEAAPSADGLGRRNVIGRIDQPFVEDGIGCPYPGVASSAVLPERSRRCRRRGTLPVSSLWWAKCPCTLDTRGDSVTRGEIETLFQELGAGLLSRGATGEIAIAGGAVMLLVVESRDATNNVDAYFGGDARVIREAAEKVAVRHGLPPDWLNGGVKGFFYGTPPQVLWRELPGLRVYAVRPDYVLAMKAVAGCPS